MEEVKGEDAVTEQKGKVLFGVKKYREINLVKGKENSIGNTKKINKYMY